MTVTTKLATQVLQKAYENSQAQNTTGQPGQSSFQGMMDATQEAFDVADMMGIEDYKMLPDGKTQSMSAADIPLNVSEGGANSFAPKEGDKVVGMLADFNEQQMHMDHLINEILYGEKKFSNQEMLAIQAHVFHVAQMTEMTVKAAELTVTSFKGVMNTQIQ